MTTAAWLLVVGGAFGLGLLLRHPRDAWRTLQSICLRLARLLYTQHWYLDAVHGSDQNSGRSARQALATHAEFARRMPQVIRRPYQVHLLADLGDPIYLERKYAWLGHLTYRGDTEPPLYRIQVRSLCVLEAPVDSSERVALG